MQKQKLMFDPWQIICAAIYKMKDNTLPFGGGNGFRAVPGRVPVQRRLRAGQSFNG